MEKRPVDPEIGRLQKWLPLAICIAGAAVRGLIVSYKQYLWLDEAMLGLSILHRNFAGLCQPLEMGQMAPLGFLWLTKACVLILGDGEMGFRALELLAGWASLWVFYRWVKETMPGQGAGAMFTLVLFSFNVALIEYSNKVKPYEFDAFFSVLLLWLGNRLLREWHARDFLWYAVCAVAAPWFSFTACFVIAAAGIVTGAQNARAGRTANLLRIGIASAVAACSLFANYWIFLRGPATRMLVFPAHQMALLRLAPHSLADVRLDVHLLLESLRYPCGFKIAALGILFLGLGAAAFIRKREGAGALVGLTLLVGMAGAFAGKYPWNGRLILFLVPMACITAGYGLEYLPRFVIGRRLKPVVALLVILALAALLAPARAVLSMMVHPYNDQGPQQVMQLISAKSAPGARVFVDDNSTPVYRYYDRDGKFSERFTVLGADYYMEDADIYEKKLLGLKGTGSAWIFFPDYYIGGTEHPVSVLATLDSMGRREDTIDLFFSKAYLYRF